MPLPRRGSKRAASGVALRMDHLTLVEFLQQDRRVFIRKGQVIAMETPASFQALHRGCTTTVWQILVKSDAGKLCGVVTQTQLILPS